MAEKKKTVKQQIAEYEAAEIISEISTREKDFAARNTRMDDDYRLWDLQPQPEPQGFTDSNGDIGAFNEESTMDVKIVSNRPRTFADKVISRLSSAAFQIICRMAAREGDDARDDIGRLERLFYFAFDQANIRLRNLLLSPFKEQAIWFSTIRGWTAARVLVYKTGGNVIFDILPLDPRYITYEMGAGGILWSSYPTIRSKGAIEAEYGKFDWLTEGEHRVYDYWRRMSATHIMNCVITVSKFLKNPTLYKMKSFPIIISPVATRPMIITPDMDRLESYGDSIFAADRALYAVLSKLISMWATHASLIAQQPIINYYGKQGEQLTKSIFYSKKVVNLPKGQNDLEAAPVKEVSPTLLSLVNSISREIEEGSLPEVDTEGKQKPSGTLYNLLQEYGNKVYNPQVVNLNNFFSDVCRLIEEQIIEEGISVSVKEESGLKYYETEIKPIHLKRAHITKVEFTHTTPWTQLDAYQIADMAKRLGLPDIFINEHILKVPDPKALHDDKAIEIYENSPEGMMMSAIKALDLMGRFDERDGLIKLFYQMTQQNEQAVAGGAAPAPPPAAGSSEVPPPPPTGNMPAGVPNALPRR